MAIAEAVFIAGLARGRGLTWRVQRRRGVAVGWREATRRFWPQTLVGMVMLAAFAAFAPHVLPWVVPVALGPLLAIPFAHYGSHPAVGRALARWRFAALPEEIDAPSVVQDALGSPSRRPDPAPWAARPPVPLPDGSD
jgi:membrane glycosyltransferase